MFHPVLEFFTLKQFHLEAISPAPQSKAHLSLSFCNFHYLKSHKITTDKVKLWKCNEHLFYYWWLWPSTVAKLHSRESFHALWRLFWNREIPIKFPLYTTAVRFRRWINTLFSWSKSKQKTDRDLEPKFARPLKPPCSKTQGDLLVYHLPKLLLLNFSSPISLLVATALFFQWTRKKHN